MLMEGVAVNSTMGAFILYNMSGSTFTLLKVGICSKIEHIINNIFNIILYIMNHIH